MVARLLKRLIQKNRAFILAQVLEVKGLMQLLMKNRNTGEPWTREEVRQIRVHLKQLSKMVPVILVFLLPGGAFLLPLLAEVLDRRKQSRPSPQNPPGPGTRLKGYLAAAANVCRRTFRIPPSKEATHAEIPPSTARRNCESTPQRFRAGKAANLVRQRPLRVPM